jgi:aspartyl-tRNA(Asn)/glutamyl-tRNA(Gln) amidotransferase subunit A
MRSGFSHSLVSAGIGGLAGVFAAGVVTPEDVLEIYLDRIDRLNPALNAFLAIDRDGAMRDAWASRSRWAGGAPRSALDGAVIGVKANIAARGLPWHAGIAAYADRLAEADAASVAALRDAGAVIVGVLNMHEAALGATNDNPAFGRCHNPYRFDFTPGGSSGGAAAAVSAGLCAGALGTDTLGSVRIPASYCGVFGHKPTHRLVSTQGVVPLSPTLDDVGIVARSAPDCRALLNVLAPDVPGAAAGARIGVIGRADLDPAVAEALSAAVEAARQAGAEIEPIDPAWDWAALRRASLAVVEIEAEAEHGALRALRREGFSPALNAMLDWAGRQTAQGARQAYDRLIQGADSIRRALARFDAVLSPCTATPAFGFDDPAPVDQADFTMLANISGLAATAFPTGLGDDGLPLSVQVMSPSDAIALDWAGRLARPTEPPGGCSR